MKYYIIDAFADEMFRGNPAGVCLVEKKLSEETMHKIAEENNLAETAFLFKEQDRYYLRWFTPEVEMDLCGHATLAAAFVMMNFVDPALSAIEFETKSGKVGVVRAHDLYQLDFPARMPTEIDIDRRLEQALGCKVLETHRARDLLVIAENEETVRNLAVDFHALRKINGDIDFTVIVSAVGTTCDFVSRFFVPNAGIREDPVTGSAHSTLSPFWGKRLGKDRMIAKQLSARGGTLICANRDQRVFISGKACCYLVGEIL